MEIYRVGGFVRDRALGIPSKDVDYVVVGSSPEEMISLGYEQVGADFPVFLHPQTGDEYALARTEKKVGEGYNGFETETVGVTLADDLYRRDLTINAMAMDSDGKIIDPYHGQWDLESGVLRHVSDHFREDPVRILRTCRFSARYDFDISSKTFDMMKEMIICGEFDTLTNERIWKEFEKVMGEKHIERFFEYMEVLGALEKLPGFPKSIDTSFFKNKSVGVYERMLYVFSHVSEKDLKEWKIPTNIKQDVKIFRKYKDNPKFYEEMSVEERLDLIKELKIRHDNKRLDLFIAICLHVSHFQLDGLQVISEEVWRLGLDCGALDNIDYQALVSYKEENFPDNGETIAQYVRRVEIEEISKR